MSYSTKLADKYMRIQDQIIAKLLTGLSNQVVTCMLLELALSNTKKKLLAKGNYSRDDAKKEIYSHSLRFLQSLQRSRTRWI